MTDPEPNFDDAPTLTRWARTPAPAPLFLLIHSGRRAETIYPIGHGGCTIGHGDDADLRLSDPGVCSRHAMILRNRDGTARIIDCQSVHGTFVDDRPIDIAHLHEYALIRLGRFVTISFHYTPPSQIDASEWPTLHHPPQ